VQTDEWYVHYRLLLFIANFALRINLNEHPIFMYKISQDFEKYGVIKNDCLSNGNAEFYSTMAAKKYMKIGS
jgi:hypothetical protein